MIGHIVKIEGYNGLWIVTARNDAGYITALSLDAETAKSEGEQNHFILYGIHPADITARTNDYAIKINSFIFDDTKRSY